MQDKKKEEAVVYNDDKVFIGNMTSATDAKSLALKKISTYFASLTKDPDSEFVCKKIQAEPFTHFNDDVVIMKVQTGFDTFPWENFFKNSNEPVTELDLSGWNPTRANTYKLNFVVEILKAEALKNYPLNVSFGQDIPQLNFKDGLTSHKKFVWPPDNASSSSPAFKGEVEIISVLLCCCQNVEEVNVRCEARQMISHTQARGKIPFLFLNFLSTFLSFFLSFSGGGGLKCL